MGITVIHSVLLFDGTCVHEAATVIFDSDNGKITSVFTGKSDVPLGAAVIDGTGYTLLPGLIESHMHCDGIILPPGIENIDGLQMSLKCGITTCCDLHSDPDVVKELREAIAVETAKARSLGGMVSTSDLKSALHAATIEDGYPKSYLLGESPSEELKRKIGRWPNVTLANAAEYIKTTKAKGADYIKIFQENCCSFAAKTGSLPSATLELQVALTKAAHAENLLVVAHANNAESTRMVLQAGADGLAHTFVDQSPPQELIDLYKATKAFTIPTLTALATLTGAEQSRRERFADVVQQKNLAAELIHQEMRKSVSWNAPEAKFEYAVQAVTKLKEEGLDIMAGTDSMVGLAGVAIGPSLWMELEMYVDLCGMSVVDALRTATAVPAKRFGLTDRGEVVPGKRADLVLVKGNVTERLQNLWEGDGVVRVWREGLEAAHFIKNR